MKKNALLALLVLAALACSRPQPNIILVTFDTTRADHMGYAGGREGITPNLDALALSGAWFPTCITAGPLTAPSHATILTGLYPFHHGVRNNGSFILAGSQPTLAAELRKGGYETHAVVSSFVLNRQFGLGRGFDSYDDDLVGGRSDPLSIREQKADVTAKKAIEWMTHRRDRNRPFFLWVHFYDPHAPYEAPAEDGANFPDDPYSAEIHFADRQLGTILKFLNLVDLWSQTILVFASDHGESLGEHGERTHGLFLYDATTRVPLLIAGAGISGRRIGTLARTADIAPTILDLAGVVSESMHPDGRSLVPLLRGAKLPEKVAYSEAMSPRLNFGWSELRSERSPHTRVVAAPHPEWYDLAHDPGEVSNLFTAAPPQAETATMMKSLQQIAAADPLFRHDAHVAPVDSETRRRLSALGYLAGSEVGTKVPRADPKDRVIFWQDFEKAQQLLASRRFDEAAAKLSPLLAADRDNPVAMTELAYALAATGRQGEAESIYRRVLAIDPAHENALEGLIALFRQERRIDDALALAREGVVRRPQKSDPWITLGDSLVDAHQLSQAEAAFRRALTIDPSSTQAVAGLGNCLNRQRRLKEALALLEQAHAKYPESAEIAYNLGVVYDHLGSNDKAVEAFKATAKLDPRKSMAWNNLGSLADRAGRRAEALVLVRKAHELDPSNSEATYNYGALLSATGHPREALPLLLEAAKERPDLVQPAIMAADLLVSSGRVDEAESLYREMARENPEALLRVALLEAQRGRRDEARKVLREAVARGGGPMEDLIRRAPQFHGLFP